MSGVQRMIRRTGIAFVNMDARVLALMFLETLLVALATGASIGGSVNLDQNSLSSSGEIVFPKIPGINKPLLPSLTDIIKLVSGIKSPDNSTDAGSQASNSTSNVSDKPSNNSNSVENPMTNNSTDSENQTADNSTNSNNQTAGNSASIGNQTARNSSSIDNQTASNSTSIGNQTENNSTSTNKPNDNSQTNDTSDNENDEKNSSEPIATNEPSTETSQSTDGQSNSSSISGLPKIPNVMDLIPKIPKITDPSKVLVTRIPNLPSLSNLANMPDLAAALEKARNQTAAAIGLGSDLISGIQEAMKKAIQSTDPTKALRTLVDTILKVYKTVAGNCPLVVVGTKVLAEGIRLSFEVAKSVKYIILG